MRLLFSMLVSVSLVACASASFGTRNGKIGGGKSRADGGAADAGDQGDTDGPGDGGRDGGHDGGGAGAGGADSGDDRSDAGGSGDAGHADGVDAGDDKSDGGNDLDSDDDDVVNKCDVPTGPESTSAVLGGEDVPGNGLVGGPDKGKPLGSDFDDYTLTFDGKMVVDRTVIFGAKIGVKKPTSIEVSYKRGTTDCAHAFEFVYRLCPNKSSKKLGTQTLEIGEGSTGSVTLKVPKANAFVDIVMSVSASGGKRYGGCPLPVPVENRLYENGMAAFKLNN